MILTDQFQKYFFYYLIFSKFLIKISKIIEKKNDFKMKLEFNRILCQNSDIF